MNALTSVTDSFTLAMFAGKEQPKAEAKGKVQKKSETEKSEGICSRIIAFVKNIFTTILYYLSCTMIDLRAKTAMFAKQEGFLILTSIPKSDEALAKLVFDNIMSQKVCKEQQTEKIKTVGDKIKSGLKEGTPEAVNSYLTLQLIVKYVSKTLKSAMEGGLVPLECQICMEESIITIYAPIKAKCPEPRSLVKEKEGVTADKWEKTKVAITKNKKKEEVECQAITVSFNFEKIPGSTEALKATFVDYSEKLLTKIKETKKALSSGSKLSERDTEKLRQELSATRKNLVAILNAQFLEVKDGASRSITTPQIQAAAKMTANLCERLGTTVSIVPDAGETIHTDKIYPGFHLVINQPKGRTPINLKPTIDGSNNDLRADVFDILSTREHGVTTFQDSQPSGQQDERKFVWVTRAGNPYLLFENVIRDKTFA